MKLFVKTIFLFLFSFQLYGQDSLGVHPKTIGIEYFGEFAFHTGLKLDFGIPFWTNSNFPGKKNRTFSQYLGLRPKLGYYNIPKYTNNFFTGLDLTFQFRTTRNIRKTYFYFESYFGGGYLRYSYVGSIYETTANGGFVERKSGGGNALMVASGFIIGGSLPFEKLEWLLGAEYFVEFSEDKLIIQHPTIRLGVRINLM